MYARRDSNLLAAVSRLADQCCTVLPKVVLPYADGALAWPAVCVEVSLWVCFVVVALCALLTVALVCLAVCRTSGDDGSARNARDACLDLCKIALVVVAGGSCHYLQYQYDEGPAWAVAVISAAVMLCTDCLHHKRMKGRKESLRSAGHLGYAKAIPARVSGRLEEEDEASYGEEEEEEDGAAESFGTPLRRSVTVPRAAV